MKEIWKDLPNLEMFFKVSNLGKIQSKIEFFDNPIGETIRRQRNRHFGKDLIGKKLSTKGYRRVSLNKKTYFVHRLVALAFLPNPHCYNQVNHIDGNKTNNKVCNLEWVTNSQNRAHAVENNLIAHGEKIGSSKLTEEQVREIKRLLLLGNLSQKQIGSFFNLKQQAISSISLGKTWKRVTA